MNSKTIAVIGGGAAGLTAAAGLVKAGYPVVLIENNFLGGECTNTGCVPSKSLLYQARKVAELRTCLQQSDFLEKAKSGEVLQVQAEKALQEVRAIRKKFREQESREWLEGLGVGLIEATAAFTGKRSLALTNIKYVSPKVAREHTEVKQEGFLFFDRCVIATGSRPAIPGIIGIDQVPYYTNESIFEIRQVPEQLLIIGAGPQGVELANAFMNLGSQVTVIGQAEVILKGKVDKEIAHQLQEWLAQKGVKFIQGRVTGVEKQADGLVLSLEAGQTLAGTHLLLASGRLPNTRLNLEKAGIRYSNKGIWINKYSQTTTDHIFAIGDCSQVPRFTHFAYYQAKKLVAHLAIRHYTKLPLQMSSFRKKRVPAVVYTDLEVAQYGYTEEKARQKWGESVEVHYLNFKELDRALIEGGEPGMVKVVTKGALARLVGVSIFAARAGEMLPEFQRLIAGREKISALDEIIRSYPSYSSSLDTLFTDWLFRKLPILDESGS